jgi:hypothetical protein
MKLAVFTFVLFALGDTTSGMAWLPEQVSSASEPVWLALWGFALIGLSGTVRDWLRAEPRMAHATPRVQQLKTINETLAGPA